MITRGSSGKGSGIGGGSVGSGGSDDPGSRAVPVEQVADPTAAFYEAVAGPLDQLIGIVPQSSTYWIELRLLREAVARAWKQIQEMRRVMSSQAGGGRRGD